jgi:hypothetical protein
MKRKILKIVILILSIILLLLCGTAFALMYRQTQPLNNQLEAAFVACAVEEDFDGETKTSIAIKNTGNIDAYLRVRLVSYWVDSDGNITSKPSRMPPVFVTSGWVTGTGNTYYYSQPVAPGDITTNLLNADITLEEEDGYLQVIEVFADAIQSKPAEAVTTSWGVTLDGDKIITAP